MCNVKCLETCPFTNKSEGQVFFEIHITVEYDSRFELICKENNIKIVHIDMGEGVPTHLMTSHTYKEKDYQNEVIRLINLFKSYNFVIERVKVESTVNHHKALENVNESYFESHISINPVNQNEDIYIKLKLHKSRNLMKVGDSKKQMLTYRTYSTLIQHQTDLENIKLELMNSGIEINKTVTEYCLEDSNINMDSLWMNKKVVEEV